MALADYMFFSFIVVAVIHLIGEVLIIKEKKPGMVVRFISKPLLMLLLLLGYILNSNISIFFVLGIIGGWGGDVLLMLPDPKGTKKAFKFGLISFLLGHVFYIVAIVIATVTFFDFKWWTILLALPFIVYGAIVQPRLSKHTGKMTKAVTVYIMVIVLMGVASAFLFGTEGNLSGILVVYVGAWFFVISDTINAFNKFAKPIKNERLYTMSTYLLGQLLIVFGFMLVTIP